MRIVILKQKPDYLTFCFDSETVSELEKLIDQAITDGTITKDSYATDHSFTLITDTETVEWYYALLLTTLTVVDKGLAQLIVALCGVLKNSGYLDYEVVG